MLGNLPGGDAPSVIEVTMPANLSAVARKGRPAVEANCAACQGTRGQANSDGDRRGPPLIHDIYNPGHHADEAFMRAARNGVRPHHWTYGDMPAQPQVSNAEIRAIVAYIREIQQANGIRYRPHNM